MQVADTSPNRHTRGRNAPSAEGQQHQGSAVHAPCYQKGLMLQTTWRAWKLENNIHRHTRLQASFSRVHLAPTLAPHELCPAFCCGVSVQTTSAHRVTHSQSAMSAQTNASTCISWREGGCCHRIDSFLIRTLNFKFEKIRISKLNF